MLTVKAREKAQQSKAQLQRVYEQLKQNEVKIRELLLTDPLTDFANRRADAMDLAECIRQDLTRRHFAQADSTVTAGFRVTTVSGAQDGTAALTKADEALYASKKHGRDRVTFMA